MENENPNDVIHKAMPSILVALIIGIASLLWIGFDSQYAKASKVSVQEQRIYKLEIAQVYTTQNLLEIKRDIKEIRNFLLGGGKIKP